MAWVVVLTLVVAMAPAAEAGKGNGKGKQDGKGKGPKPKPSTCQPVSAPPAGNFGTPSLVDDRFFLAEPGVDVSGDGDVYVNAPAGLGVPSFLFRRNGDGTWTDVSPFAVPGGGDSDVALGGVDPVNGDDTVYWSDLWLGSSSVGVSDDSGGSWTNNPLGGPLIEDRQWLASPGDGRVYLVTNQLLTGLVVSSSTDGVFYSEVGTAATPGDRGGRIGPPGTIVAVPQPFGDFVGVAYDTADGRIRFARSPDAGELFTSVTVASGLGDSTLAFPVVAWAGGSNLVMVFQGTTGTGSSRSTQTWFARSGDLGLTWTAGKIVTTGSSAFPWVDARGSKVVVTLYYTPDDVRIPDAVCGTARWYEVSLGSADGGAGFTPLTAVDDAPVKEGPICTQGTDCDDDRQLLDFQSVALDPAGRANVAWTRLVGENGPDEHTEILYAREPS